MHGELVHALVYALGWGYVWESFGADANAGRLTQIARCLLCLFAWRAVDAIEYLPTGGLTGFAGARTPPLDAILLPLQVHGALFYSLGGWQQLQRGLRLRARTTPWRDAWSVYWWSVNRDGDSLASAPDDEPIHPCAQLFGCALRRDWYKATEDLCAGSCDVVFGLCLLCVGLNAVHWAPLAGAPIEVVFVLMQASFVPYLVIVLRDALQGLSAARRCTALVEGMTIVEQMDATALLQHVELLCEGIEMFPWERKVASHNQSALPPPQTRNRRGRSASPAPALRKSSLAASKRSQLAAGPSEQPGEELPADLPAALDEVLRCVGANGSKLAVTYGHTPMLRARAQVLRFDGSDMLLRTFALHFLAFVFYSHDSLVYYGHAQLAQRSTLGVGWLQVKGAMNAAGDICWAAEPILYFCVVAPLRRTLVDERIKEE